MKVFSRVSLGALVLHFVGGCLPQATAEGPLSNGYSIDRGSVYYRDDKLHIDPAGFEVLGDHWIKNDTQYKHDSVRAAACILLFCASQGAWSLEGVHS